jgi:NADH dehydrogenase (ubiquinone) Fe-S protein 1
LYLDLYFTSVNDLNYFTFQKQTVIQTLALQYFETPRFCYSEYLTVGGNCRMCLTEEDKSFKLLAACAITIGKNILAFFTNTINIK